MMLTVSGLSEVGTRKMALGGPLDRRLAGHFTLHTPRNIVDRQGCP